MAKTKDYTNLNDSPYNKLLSRESDLSYQFGSQYGVRQTNSGVGAGSDDGTTQTKGGSVATVALKSEGNATDVWIQNFIRSVNWKPKKVGFYINGATGYAEFANIFVAGSAVIASGTIGGFEIGSDYIRDALDTMGMSSAVTGGDDVRFWAGDTYANRALAPFRVLESGQLYANNVVISGGTIDGATLVNLTGTADPVTIPEAVGQLYINTLEERFFIAVATTDFNDWMLFTAIRLTRYVSVTNNATVSESISISQASNVDQYDSSDVSEDIVLTII